ncbi:hypothetical protein [Granulicella arctica]|uniref:hypothetical protein n=1 Tax=Granulicella arctica TaxID=940613 RepID=UPI0021E07338|nr:hypothetical protein [Granulicella arctica]
MKRLSVVAVCVAGLVITAGAQRGGAHATIGGHSGPAMRSGLGSAPSGGFTGAPRYTGSRSMGVTPAFRSGSSAGALRRPNGPGAGGYRRPYGGAYRSQGPYVGYPWSGLGGVAFLGYPDTTGLNDGTASYDNEPTGNGDPSQGPYAVAPYSGQAGDAALPPYPPQYAQQPLESVAPPPPAREPAPEEAVTLIFKDGRPAEQIHNYMLTRTTLYVRDQHHHEIPVSELDEAATTRANKAAGVDFQLLPNGSQ